MVLQSLTNLNILMRFMSKPFSQDFGYNNPTFLLSVVSATDYIWRSVVQVVQERVRFLSPPSISQWKIIAYIEIKGDFGLPFSHQRAITLSCQRGSLNGLDIHRFYSIPKSIIFNLKQSLNLKIKYCWIEKKDSSDWFNPTQFRESKIATA